MGDEQFFQPLTKEDKITVILYRIGIVLSAVIISVASFMILNPAGFTNDPAIILRFNIFLLSLYISVGMSVFFIHLYVSKFKKILKRIYYAALICLIALLVIGKGNVLGIVAQRGYCPLLLVPLSLCLGFITAKEAFCFRLVEGYLLAMVMPFYLLLLSAGALTVKGAAYGLLIIAFMLIFFTLRKVSMPIHYDIGDKSAYI